MEIHLKPETTTIDNGDTHLKQDLKQQQLTMEIHLKLTIEIYLNKKHLNKLYLKKQHQTLNFKGEILQKGKVCSSISEIKSTIRKRKIKLKKSEKTIEKLRQEIEQLKKSLNKYFEGQQVNRATSQQGNKSIGQQVNIELKKDNENLTKHLEKFKVENSKLKIKFMRRRKGPSMLSRRCTQFSNRQ